MKIEHSDKECSKDCECDNCIAKVCGLSINVLTKDESFILDLINQIADPIKKRQALEKYLQEKPFSKSTKSFEKVDNESYTLQKVYSKTIKVANREPTITDLKSEINIVKSELMVLKERVSYLENTNFSKGKIHFKEVSKDESYDEEKYDKEREDISKNLSLILGDDKVSFLSKEKIQNEFKWINTIDGVIIKKWFTEVTLIINKEFSDRSN